MEQKPTLAEVKKKFREWKKINEGQGMIPRRLKSEAIHLLDRYSKMRLAKELGLNESCIRAWQRRILEIEHDSGIDRYVNEVAPKPSSNEPANFVELGGAGSTPDVGGGRPALMLRRTDGAVMSIKGELTATQIKALTMTFLGDTR